MEKIENIEKLTDLQILQKLVDGLKTLKPDEFIYKHFVSSHELDIRANVCGTVCCAWGWVYRFVPEIGLKFGFGENHSYTINKLPSDTLTIDGNLISFMFYGSELRLDSVEDTESIDILLFGYHINNISLNQVINRINYVINRI